MKKQVVRDAIIEALRREAEGMLGSSKATRATGNDPHSKAEGKYDTRSTEENYLADGLARQAQAALDAQAAFEGLGAGESEAQEAIALGALVELEFPDERAWFYLGPAAGGTEVEWEGHVVTVITPESPLGKQLLGAKVGDRVKSPAAVVRQIQ